VTTHVGCYLIPDSCDARGFLTGWTAEDWDFRHLTPLSLLMLQDVFLFDLSQFPSSFLRSSLLFQDRRLHRRMTDHKSFQLEPTVPTAKLRCYYPALSRNLRHLLGRRLQKKKPSVFFSFLWTYSLPVEWAAAAVVVVVVANYPEKMVTPVLPPILHS